MKNKRKLKKQKLNPERKKISKFKCCMCKRKARGIINKKFYCTLHYQEFLDKKKNIRWRTKKKTK